MPFDIERDVGFPLQDDERVEKLLIGTLLTLFSGFLVPLLPLYGYLMNVARAGMTGTAELPAFDEWESLFVDGIKAFVILLVSQLPPLLLAILSFGGLFALGSESDSIVALGVLVFVVGLLVAAVAWILSSYLGVVAVLTFAHERELGAAFDVETIRDVALDTDFAISWLYGVGLAIGLNVLVGVVLFFVQLIALVPIIGWIIAIGSLFLIGPLSAAVSFYAQVVTFRVWGRGYADSRGLGADVIRGPGGRAAADTAPSTSAERMSGADVEGGPS